MRGSHARVGLGPWGLHSCLEPKSQNPGPRTLLLLVGNRQALAALGAAALQYLPAVLGRHADQEAVTLGAAAGIRLKRSLALLRSSHFSPPPSRRSRSGRTSP